MEQQSKTRLTTALILAAVFSSGVLLGFAADSNLGAEPAGPVVPTESADEGEGGEAAAEEGEDRSRGMYMQVEPNEVELARIDSIVAEFAARLDAHEERVRSEYRSGRRTIVNETREAIKGALAAEKAAEYQAILDEWDAKRAAERENRDDQN